MNRNFTMTLSSILIILPMCYSKKIDFLRLPSALGVLSILYIVLMIAAEYFWGGFPTPDDIKVEPGNWTDIFLVVPDITFGYQVIFFQLNFKHNLRRQESFLHKFSIKKTKN